jgi:hypothetical protein
LSLPQRLAAYEDCRRFFERAAESKLGSRAAFKTFGEANIFCLRMQTFRKLEREEMQRIYEAQDPAWGKTEWDHLIVKRPIEGEDSLWWIYVSPAGGNIVTVEDIDAETTI